jgi:hypothetical protein
MNGGVKMFEDNEQILGRLAPEEKEFLERYYQMQARENIYNRILIKIEEIAAQLIDSAEKDVASISALAELIKAIKEFY